MMIARIFNRHRFNLFLECSDLKATIISLRLLASIIYFIAIEICLFYKKKVIARLRKKKETNNEKTTIYLSLSRAKP